MNTRASDVNGVWKYLRLWPIILTISSLIGIGYVAIENIGDLQATDTRLWLITNANSADITELEKQTGIIDFRLQSVDELLRESRADIKEILKAVK